MSGWSLVPMCLLNNIVKAIIKQKRMTSHLFTVLIMYMMQKWLIKLEV